MFAAVFMDENVPGKQKSGEHPLFSKVSSILTKLYHILILKAMLMKVAIAFPFLAQVASLPPVSSFRAALCNALECSPYRGVSILLLVRRWPQLACRAVLLAHTLSAVRRG